MSTNGTDADQQIERILRESLDLSSTYIDPFERFRDPVSGEFWGPVGGYGSGTSATDCSRFRTQQELTDAREFCRLLAELNPFCISGIENRISYVAGVGHKYTAVARKGIRVDPRVVAAAQQAVDAFAEVNRWTARQQEITRRMDRDGEVFLRYFVGDDGIMRVRFVEPDQVAEPLSKQPHEAFGIITDPSDVETVVGYYIDGGQVDAAEIQHRKANVDCNVRRGRPTFWPVRELLLRAVKLLINIAKTSDIQTAIGLIRRHMNGTKAGLTTARATAADVTVSSNVTGKTKFYQQSDGGKILDVNSNTEYEFPASGINVERFVAGVAALLRAIASRLVMPEFMLTSDASNANYSSTLVAEGPAAKMFQRLQATMIEHDLQVIWRAVEMSPGIPENVCELVEIQAEPPTVTSRNVLEETQRDAVLKDAGVLSPQTWAARAGLDYDQEQKNIAEHRAKNPPPEASPKQAVDAPPKPADPSAAANVNARESAWAAGYPFLQSLTEQRRG